jgi:Gly-Xaa carboxypeptidase
MGHVGEDDRWNKFGAFHAYLEKAFPRTHAKLSLAKVNTWGLVFEWKGSRRSSRPFLWDTKVGALVDVDRSKSLS